MKPALLVFCCAIAVAWILPRPLGRLSGPGASPRLGIAAWLAAMASVLALRLADPLPPARRAGHGLALAALILAIIAVSALVSAFAVAVI